jgi:cytosine/adenosine deaminase-related metal-dependent hydrolase
MDERLLIEARNRTVAIEGGVIAEPSGRYDLVLRFPHADVRPGLINAHDHLHRNHYGRLGSPPYRDARAWGRDIQSRWRRTIAEGRALPGRQALLAGAWKNLCAGVTSVVHHDPWEGDFERDFPLRVIPVASADSLDSAHRLAGIAHSAPFCRHVAEGTGPAAADDVRRLHAIGMLDRRLIAVHGLGMDADAIALFRASGAALVWCPSSNLFLFGRTAPAELLREGIDVLLGSDSLLSGAGDLLDELRLAKSLGTLDDARLEAAVGSATARRLGLPEPALEPGSAADLVVLAQPLLEAGAQDVELVLVGGAPRVAHPRLQPEFGRRGGPGHLAVIIGLSRWICAASRPAGMNLSPPSSAQRIGAS